MADPPLPSSPILSSSSTSSSSTSSSSTSSSTSNTGGNGALHDDVLQGKARLLVVSNRLPVTMVASTTTTTTTTSTTIPATTRTTTTTTTTTTTNDGAGAEADHGEETEEEETDEGEKKEKTKGSKEESKEETKENEEEEEASWTFHMSSGGLVSALSGLLNTMTFTWIGWPGVWIPEEQQEAVRKKLREEYSCVPVLVPDALADQHYNGFCNSILWPLFHYLPGEINFKEEDWNAYQLVNEMFANALRDIVQDGDFVWIQDYHLMLLPHLLRQRLPPSVHVQIGFFLHTPFPSSEVYRVLPVRRQILQALLLCDLIGFHTYDYARHFLSSCTRILGLSTMPNGVDFEGRFVHVGTFPVGIQPENFSEGLQLPEVRDRIASLRKTFEGKTIILGVDRLDYIKGVPQKLHGLEVFFSLYPDFQDKVVLIQVAVPSRTDVEEYQQLRSSVNEHVGRLNGQYGAADFMPIHFLNKSVDFKELCALYYVADICLITSTRDGMNLVSYEYVACQQERHGVLILSEFAGAAQSLNGSIIINPWNAEELAEAIHSAVVMPADEREANHEKLYRYVTKYTAAYWGKSFVEELAKISQEKDRQNILPKLEFDQVLAKYERARRKRVIFLDYDGTLTRMHKLAEFSAPGPEVVRVVMQLSSHENTFVYVLSGRDRRHLEAWFEGTGVGLGAEHGCFFKHPAKMDMPGPPGENGWFRMVDEIDMSWREEIRPLFRHYTDRTPGSFIEEKEINLTWHYRNADPEFGQWQAAELQFNLDKILSHLAVTVVLGSKTVEVRPASVDKSTVARVILRDLQGDDLVDDPKHTSIEGDGIDFLLCIGDGRTDEVIFSLVEPLDYAITCTVGKKQTKAKSFLENEKMVVSLLAELTKPLERRRSISMDGTPVAGPEHPYISE